MNAQEMELNLAYQALYLGMKIALYLYRQENVLPIQIPGVLAILLQVVLQAWPSAIILQLPMMKLQGGSTTNSFLALSLYSSSI
jgi:hypothetical protein